jgi:hypothetical protein
MHTALLVLDVAVLSGLCFYAGCLFGQRALTRKLVKAVNELFDEVEGLRDLKP